MNHIYYSSATGNTAQVARAIYGAFPPEAATLTELSGNETPPDGLLFVGFWTDKGVCDQKAATFLQSLHGRKVALFGTMGGGQAGYGESICRRVAALLPPDNRVVGTFTCQGKLEPGTKARYEEMRRLHPENEHILVQLQNYEQAQTHPDAEDLRAAAAFAVKTAAL